MKNKENTKIGNWYMPENGPIHSSIKVISSSEQGLKLKRMNLNHVDEFFMNWKGWEDSLWVEVPSYSQLQFI